MAGLSLGLGFGLTRTGPDGLIAPAGFAFVVHSDGTYPRADDGAYLISEIA